MKSILKFLVIATLLSLSINAQGQIKVDLKKKINAKVNQRVNQRTDQAIDKGMDAVENDIKNSSKKTDETNQANDTQKNQESKKEGADDGDTGNKPAGQEQNQLQSYSKYDFIPGEKVIFYEDFSQDAVGDFPALWNTNGSAEIVTTNLFPGKWMRFSGWEAIWTDELLKLPENYTIEYDLINIPDMDNNMPGCMIRLMQAKNAKAWDSGTVPGQGGFEFHTDYGRPFYSTWLFGAECEKSNLSGHRDEEMYKEKVNVKYHVAIWVQKTRLRIYQDETKVFDIPRAFPTGCVKPDRIRFERGTAMVSNIRIAVGAPDMRNKLMTEGKLVTYGIYFDVNKDIVKPESNGTLKEISTILNEVPDVKVKITGFTDSDGADAANLDLSKRRAASVKNELVKSFGVNGDRLVTDGMGEGQPVAPNDTPANKALNRRVEFLKL